METKACVDCQQEKPFSDFYKQSRLPGGLKHSCKECSDEKTEEWRLKNREAWNRKGRDFRLRLRREVLGHYGAVCTCCGETREEFLGMDHIKGGGNKHRKEIGQSNLYSWLKRNNFPSDFQVNCHNCNDAKGFYGYCPHEVERRSIDNLSDTLFFVGGLA